jgi:hypothetical protein
MKKQANANLRLNKNDFIVLKTNFVCFIYVNSRNIKNEAQE